MQKTDRVTRVKILDEDVCISHRANLEVMYDLSSPVVGSHSVGRRTSRLFCRVCLGTGEFLRPKAPLKRGMPTGSKVFLALPDACRLRPCDRTHIKNGLVPHSYVGWTYDK